MAGLSHDHHRLPKTRNRARTLGALAASGLPFVVYLYYLCPTIAGGDTTELINCAAVLGIPHAPGYPLFTMLGHAFTWIPLHSVAWRVNLSSAVFSALACLFVYLSLLRLTGRVWAALAGAWGLGSSRLFWHYAEVAEVFPLNSLFVTLITYCLIRFNHSAGEAVRLSGMSRQHPVSPRARRFFWLLCLLSGLALANHHTITLLLPASLLFLWFSAPGLFREGRTLAVGVSLVLVGLTPYIYCPMAARAEPVLNWGNPVTLDSFVRLILRMDFGTFRLAEVTTSSSRLHQIPVFFGSLYDQFTPLGIGLGVLGLFAMKRYRLVQAYLWLVFLFSGIFFPVFANYPTQEPLRLGVLHRFYMMPAVIFSFWIGLGVHQLLSYIEGKGRLHVFCQATAACLVAGLFTWEFNANLDETNFRDNYMAEDLAYNVLLCLPENALFFVQGDMVSMGVDYFQIVLGQRTDVVKLNQEELTFEWYYKQAKRRFSDIVLRGVRYDGVSTLNLHFIGDNIDKKPICFRYFKEDSYKKTYRALKNGLIHIMVPKDRPYSLQEIEEHTNRLWNNFKKRGWQRRYPQTSFEHVVKGYYAEPFVWLGYEFAEAGDIEKAVRYYRKALEQDQNQSAALKNLGILYFYKMKRPREAAEVLTRYLKLHPHDPDADGMRRMIRTTGNASARFPR